MSEFLHGLGIAIGFPISLMIGAWIGWMARGFYDE